MKISKKDNNDKGFTLIELIVVVAGLSILSSLAIPNILNQIKLNRIEGIKASMNGFAADCLGKSRTYDGNDLTLYLESTSPNDLDNVRLSTLGYKIDGSKNKCNDVAIKPLKDSENDLFPLNFKVIATAEGTRVFKAGTPPPSLKASFIKSCENWAGEFCGLSDEQKAEIARIEAIAKNKSTCNANLNTWIALPGTGEFNAWDDSNNTCTRKIFAFEGEQVNSLEGIKKAEDAKYGSECREWRDSQKNANIVSSEDNPVNNAACQNQNLGPYWFHTGDAFTSKTEFLEKVIKQKEIENTIKKQACIDDRNRARNSVKGEYTYKPESGPPPCGDTVWICNGTAHTSLSSYQASSCAPSSGGGGGGGKICRNGKLESKFEPHSRCEFSPSLKDRPLCKC